MNRAWIWAILFRPVRTIKLERRKINGSRCNPAQVIIAMFSDDLLMEKFALNGGNALSLVYGIGGRTSIDVDLSIPDDFNDIDEVSKRASIALKDRLKLPDM